MFANGHRLVMDMAVDATALTRPALKRTVRVDLANPAQALAARVLARMDLLEQREGVDNPNEKIALLGAVRLDRPNTRHAPNARRYHRAPAAKRLQYYVGASLPQTGKAENVACSHPIRNLAVRLSATEPYHVAEAFFGNYLAQCVF